MITILHSLLYRLKKDKLFYSLHAIFLIYANGISFAKIILINLRLIPYCIY